MHPLSRAKQRDLAALTGIAENDLRVMWARFDSAEGARDGLLNVLPGLVAIYGAAAATLAADYYDDLRAEKGVRGGFRAIPAEPHTGEGLDVLARWAVGPMFQATPDPAAALSRASGGMQRFIANASRETGVQSALADPAAMGWMRVGHGECDWCKRYLDGEVHYVAGYDFDAHDWCKCDTETVYD